MERKIYEYNDGTGIPGRRFADPLKALRMLAAECGGDLAGVVEGCRSESPLTRIKSTEQFLRAGRIAFGLADFNAMNGQGVTDETVLTVLDDFFDFLEKKNPTPASSPTLRPATDSPDPSPTTACSLACG